MKYMARYGRSLAEFIDFIKDINYAYSVNHKSYIISLLLWVFSLFGVIYTAINILLMT